MTSRILLSATLGAFLITSTSPGKTPDGKALVVLVAGKPSHGPGAHEHNAGVQLFAKCLQQSMANKVEVKVHLTAEWPSPEELAKADTLVVYADGGGGNIAAKDDHAQQIDEQINRGMGFGVIHYACEVPKDKGANFQKWIGGYYETNFSCNPDWEPMFEKFPVHPITRGVTPFHIKSEWYFNMRFVGDFNADGPKESDGMKFTPILIAKPSDEVRNGPYINPKGPYPHIQQASGRNEAMMWAVERKDGGRGFGFTGGHHHISWGLEGQRKAILNAIVWSAKVEVPPNGVESKITDADLAANLDDKSKKKPKEEKKEDKPAAPVEAPK
jgi:type 1 glutamine amidotransferase